MKIGVVSLGCPKNLVDSEVMMGLIRDRKWELTNDPSHADIIIVNTCGFIESAKTESINTILQMAEYKKIDSHRKLIMTGCLGQRYAHELFEQMPEVDAIIGTECYDAMGRSLIAWKRESVLCCLKRLSNTPSLRAASFPLRNIQLM